MKSNKLYLKHKNKIHFLLQILLRTFLFIVCIFVVLAIDLMASNGGFTNFTEKLTNGYGSLPAVRSGLPVVLSIALMMVLFTLACLISIVTKIGILALVKGLFIGLSLNSVMDLYLDRNKAKQNSIKNLYLWFGRGSIFTFIICIWVGIINPFLSGFGNNPTNFLPISKIVNIYVFSGFFIGILFVTIGIISLIYSAYISRNKPQKEKA
jgi:hypothetical protein